MNVLGLTGGTGSGKSTVSRFAQEMGAYIIDADIVARKVVEKGSIALSEIEKNFGKDVIQEDGNLNRKKLGQIVFSNKEKLQILNKITHKHIIEDIKNQLKSIEKDKTHNIAVIDAAVLIQSGLNRICNYVCVVFADEKIRIERIMDRDNLTYKEAVNRIKSQMSFSEMKQYADYIIKNNKDLKSVKKSVEKMINDIEGR